MPDRKPGGGFLEIGEFDGDTYAWENSVKLLLGSNGKVYAEVVECVTICLISMMKGGRSTER